MGVSNLIPQGYEISNMTAQELAQKDLDELISCTEIAMVSSEFDSPEKIFSLINTLIANQIQVIYLASEKDKLVPQLFSIGCQGIVYQDLAGDQLPIAINAVTNQGTYYSQGLLNNSYMVFLGPLLEMFEELDNTIEEFTPKEKEVFDLFVQGISISNIATELDIARSTVNSHMEAIQGKVGVSSNREILAKHQISRLKDR